MRHVLDLVKPKPETQYVLFNSFADGAEGGRHYDVHRVHNMRHQLSLLAYDKNGQPLTVSYGAPLRLRCENELGFKMVKWIEAIEFVERFDQLGAGQEAIMKTTNFFGYRMPFRRARTRQGVGAPVITYSDRTDGRSNGAAGILCRVYRWL